MKLLEIKIKLKERLALGLNYGLQSLEESLSDTSVLKDEIVTFKSQYNDLNKIASQGILGYEQVEIGYNKIRQGLLVMIGKIEDNDLMTKKSLPKVQNNELQNRKENFFELLKIHFKNLENVTVKLTNSFGERESVDLRKGREAFSFLYKDVFKYDFLNPRNSDDVSDVAAFSKIFFEEKYPRLEAYMNTLGFILKYINEAEVDQGFFYGVVKSVLSSTEKAMVFYFGLGSGESDFIRLLKESSIVDEKIKNRLVKEEHFELM